MNHNDEKLLKEKLTHKTSSKLENEFWDKFENEFNPKKPFFLFSPQYAFAAVFLVAIIGSYTYLKSGNEMVKLSHAQIEMMENYELLNDLNEEMIELTDRDWEIILAES